MTGWSASLIRWSMMVSTLLIGGCNSWKTYGVPLNSGESLNQETAVRISRDVIRQGGYDPNDFQLEPIRDDAPPEERYFGTSPAPPPHGYVMWRLKKPSNERLGLTVSLEEHERVAVCKLTWWH